MKPVIEIPDIETGEMAGRYATALVAAMELVTNDPDYLGDQERHDLANLAYHFTRHLAKQAQQADRQGAGRSFET